jgi:probable FeS assembly SUF system protein SufT
MAVSDSIKLKRDCDAIEIPSGIHVPLSAGTLFHKLNSLGGSHTIASDSGAMYRIDEKDSDALGIESATPVPAPAVESGAFSEKSVWNELKKVYDPEIPVNIVDLGLIYSCKIANDDQGGHKVEVKMSMTAPGCGMANVLKADVENRLSRLPEMKEVHVEIVFDPPWNPGRMSPAAKLQLGLDPDFGEAPGNLPIVR